MEERKSAAVNLKQSAKEKTFVCREPFTAGGEENKRTAKAGHKSEDRSRAT